MTPPRQAVPLPVRHAPQPTVFPDPEKFDPLRFTPDAVKAPPKCAYFPFGGGPRVRTGEPLAILEGKIGLPCILQRFRFTFVPGETLVPTPSVTLGPKNGIRMWIHERAT